ncbi:MAG: hypothetical protein QNJ53_07625 [Pleurocapsa sp. MO_192.B19]|nr:hypothetical protein [Pleurocapsa sp. MO_192.B19]
MNSANLPVFTLFLAVVYLLSIYGLLKMAEMHKRGENIISHNTKETSNYTKIP